MPSSNRSSRLAFVALVAMPTMLALNGCGPDPATMTRFQDHPEDFKGKSVTAVVTYDGGADAMLADVMRASQFFNDPFAGKFKARTSDGFLTIQLDIPYSLIDSVPNAGVMDRLSVTFDCAKGKLDSGNLVTSIARY